MATRRAPPPQAPDLPGPASCGHACAECGAGACGLCVCCPLALLWCSVGLPVRLAWRAARRAWSWRRRRARGRLVAASSSFSDIDFDADLAESAAAEHDADRDRRGRCWGFCVGDRTCFRWGRDRSRVSSAVVVL